MAAFTFGPIEPAAKECDFNSEALLQVGTDKTVSVAQVEFSCPVSGIISGNRIMDNKTYKALKEDKHPYINFLINPQNNVRLSEDNRTVAGLLTIAGKTKEVKFPCNVTFTSNERFKISGEAPLRTSTTRAPLPSAKVNPETVPDSPLMMLRTVVRETAGSIRVTSGPLSLSR